MVRVAFIDNGINFEDTKNTIAVSHYEILNNRCITKNAEINNSSSHGSICGRLLLNITRDIEIIDIRVFVNGEGLITDIRHALELCLSLQVQIVNFSCGTTNYLFYKKIEPYIIELQKHHIFIVAAYSNDNIVTFPASCKGILGVRSYNGNEMDFGEIAFQKEKGFHDENCILACSNPPESFVDMIITGNSFAVPIVIGKMVPILNDKRDITFDELLKKLHSCAVAIGSEEPRIQKTYRKDVTFITPPVICLYSDEIKDLNILKQYFSLKKLQGIVVSDNKTIEGCIPLSIYDDSNKDITADIIYTLDQIYCPDFIIFYLSKNAIQNKKYNEFIDFVIIRSEDAYEVIENRLTIFLGCIEKVFCLFDQRFIVD